MTLVTVLALVTIAAMAFVIGGLFVLMARARGPQPTDHQEY